MSSSPRAASLGDEFPGKLPHAREAWLTFGFAFYSITTLISMAAMSVGAVVLVVSALLAFGPASLWERLREGWREPKLGRFFLLSALLAGACLLSLIVAQVWPLEYAGDAVRVSYATDMAKAWYLFWPLFLVPCLSALSHRSRKRVILSWLGAFAVLSMIGVQQYFTGWPRPKPIPGNDPYFHATLFLGHHLSVASILIFPFFTSLALATESDRVRRFDVSRGLWITVSALGAACLFFTFSRNLWGALPAGVALLLFLKLPKQSHLKVVVGLGVALTIAAAFPAVRSRALVSIGISDRWELWKANLEFLTRRPLTGSGWHHNFELAGAYLKEKFPGETSFVGHAHNNVLEVLGSTGLLGFVAWTAWCLWLLAGAWKARAHPLASGFFCALVVLQINGLTQVNFWESKVLHQIMWAASWLLVGLL